MTEEDQEVDTPMGVDQLLIDPPDFIFEIWVGGQPRARVFGDHVKRNWVLWKLSEYAIALEDSGIVSVKRYINGKWENANDWRNLAN